VAEMDEIADIISTVIRNRDNNSVLDATSLKVRALCDKFPIYQP